MVVAPVGGPDFAHKLLGRNAPEVVVLAVLENAELEQRSRHLALPEERLRGIGEIDLRRGEQLDGEWDALRGEIVAHRGRPFRYERLPVTQVVERGLRAALVADRNRSS